MSKTLNFKILGAGPTGILLSIALSKLNLNIFLTDLVSREKIIDKDKTYAITHSTKIILEKFSVWKKLKPYLCGFDTLSISDSLTSSLSTLTISDLDEDISSDNSIGWVIKHSDLMNVFFQVIDKKNNIYFISQQKLREEKIPFAYEFISTGANSIDKRNYKMICFNKSYNQACLTFKVLVRGNTENCAYEIFREEGPLALLPLDKRVYQVIWTSSTFRSMERLNSDKNFLLDNLSSILPNSFNLYQIIGDVGLFPVSLSLKLPIFNFRKSALVGDSFHTFHPVGGQGLNTCWRDVNCIFDILNQSSNIGKTSLKLFKFKYYCRRIFDVITTIIITDSLIKIFANKNLFLFPIRKLSFSLLNNFNFFRRRVLNQMTKSIVFSNLR